MWSHYTRSHTGVCLHYEFPAKYMNETYPPIAGSEGASEEIYFVGGSEVQYGDNAFTRWLTREEIQSLLDEWHHPTRAEFLAKCASCHFSFSEAAVTKAFAQNSTRARTD